MGALHGGHTSLVQRAAAECEEVLASIFINPMQFEDNSDLERYPQTLEEDCAVLEQLGATAVYLPAAEDVYPPGFQVSVDPGPVADRFEGAARPGHFAGVATVVLKLLMRTGVSRAYFGEKDAQQLFLVQRMARDLDLKVEILPCTTVREADGLALSSRNVHLSAADRSDAVRLHRGLSAAAEAFAAGERDLAALQAALTAPFSEGAAELAYAAIVDDETFDHPVAGVGGGPWRAIVAARVAGVHLLDNLSLGRP
jgi:pantoate--beta-alanine ligase